MHGKLWEVPTEPRSDSEGDARLPEHPAPIIGTIGADEFRQEAEYYEGLTAFFAKPPDPELYAQFWPEATQVDLDEVRERFQAVAKQLRSWQYRAERDAAFKMWWSHVFMDIEEIEASVRLQQRRARESKDAEEAHRRDAAEAHPTKDAAEAHKKPLRRQRSEEDAEEAHRRDAA